MDSRVEVTRPSLAPLGDYVERLQTLWGSGVLTHNGPFVQELELLISRYLSVPDTVAVTNGTTAIQVCLRALGIRDCDVVTTPFSWQATCSAILAENCCPIFADVDEGTFNLDPARVEAAITPQTRAILAVHVFSNPCDVDALEEIARRYGLALIFDSAHAFGVDLGGKSIMRAGDASATSFHATKIFNTAEGGACFSESEAVTERMRQIRFFGFNNDRQVVADGINGKMTELHAALGIVNLDLMTDVLSARRHTYELYQQLLSTRDDLRWQQIQPESYNFSYVPVIFESERKVMSVQKSLDSHGIGSRRYFHPSLNTVMTSSTADLMPVAERIASRILCLPSFLGISDEVIEKVCRLL